MKNVLVVSGKEEDAIAPNRSAHGKAELLLRITGFDI
jgi:hypothetical protein